MKSLTKWLSAFLMSIGCAAFAADSVWTGDTAINASWAESSNWNIAPSATNRVLIGAGSSSEAPVWLHTAPATNIVWDTIVTTNIIGIATNWVDEVSTVVTNTVEVPVTFAVTNIIADTQSATALLINNGGALRITGADAENQTLSLSGGVSQVGLDGTDGLLNIENGGWLYSFNGAQFGATADTTGTLALASSGRLSTQNSAIHIGQSGVGTVIVNGYSRLETVSVGSQQSTAANLIIGNNVGSEGFLYMTNSAVYSAYNFTVGGSGYGYLEMNGGNLQSARTFTVGLAATGVGEILITAGTMAPYTIAIGASGKGLMTVSSPNVTFTGPSSTIGVNESGEGMLVLDNATFTGNPTTTHVVGQNGAGALILRNGTYASSSGSSFYVRQNAIGSGLVRGWGAIKDFRNIRNNGVIIADGEGEDRELALNINRHDGRVYNDIENEVSGANGWYAVNKGKLTLRLRTVQNSPAMGLGVTTPVFSWGESEDDDTIDLVNSLRLGFTEATANGIFSASILATDRSDVPPLSSAAVVGLWLASFDKAFTSIDLECRYDHTKLPSGHSVRLLRWDADAAQWKRLPTYESGTHRVKTDALPTLGVERIGLIAAVAEPTATFIMIK